MTRAPGAAILLEWARLTRWRDWAQSKLPFMTAVTVLLVSPTPSARRVLEIVATVMAGAAFGYGLNDVADRASDARAGKPNRAAALGPSRWVPFLVLTGGAAFGLSLVWAPDAAGPVLVLVGLGLAVAYSAPPIRLKERGGVALAGAAGAQWAVPVLVVAAAEPGGWKEPAAWAFAALSLAIGMRWMAVHQVRDVMGDRRAGLRTYASRRDDLSRVLLGTFACELVLLAAGLVLAWDRSAPVAIALGPFLLWEALLLGRRGGWTLPGRLAGYEDAPLASFYFFGMPVALAIGLLVTESDAGAVAAVLLVLALPHVCARALRWRGGAGGPDGPQPLEADWPVGTPEAGAATSRARASTQRPVVSASEPHP